MIKNVSFIVLTILVFQLISSVFLISDRRNYQWIRGFYEENDRSLDVVLIGGSNIYAFWAAPIAWNNYGITSWTYTCNSMPLVAAEYCIREAFPRHPNSIYVIGLNTFYHKPDSSMIHWMADYMPFSKNKLEMINQLSKIGEINKWDTLEFYFPVIRFHSRWEELTKEDFDTDFEGIKGASHYKAFLENVKDLSKGGNDDSEAELYDWILDSVNRLLDYSKENNITLVFVTTPQFRTEQYTDNIGKLSDYITQQGFPVVQMFGKVDDVGLDASHDFYNANHTNIHGAVKTTDYLAKYLIENYGLEDKRGKAEYRDWDEAYKTYADLLSMYSLPFEYAENKRNYSLAIPKIKKKKGKLSWEAVDRSDGYGIFVKDSSDGWRLISCVDNSCLSWEDENYSKDRKYTVVAFTLKEDELLWGNLDISNNG